MFIFSNVYAILLFDQIPAGIVADPMNFIQIQNWISAASGGMIQHLVVYGSVV